MGYPGAIADSLPSCALFLVLELDDGDSNGVWNGDFPTVDTLSLWFADADKGGLEWNGDFPTDGSHSDFPTG